MSKTRTCASCNTLFSFSCHRQRDICDPCYEWVPPPMPGYEADVQTCLSFLKATANDWLWSDV